MPEETKPDPHILDLRVMDAAIARGRLLRSKAYYDFVRMVGHGLARAVGHCLIMERCVPRNNV